VNDVELNALSWMVRPGAGRVRSAMAPNDRGDGRRLGGRYYTLVSAARSKGRYPGVRG
jgi:hypothetical protein